VLKPLCGAEPHLYENLAGLCRQDYPDYQLVFGVCAYDDPAITVVNRLRKAFPERDIVLIVDARTHGRNPKVSNLINLYRAARHAHLVIADSDIAVPPDYLRRLAGPLSDPHVGVVTCLYRGRPVDGIWSRLGAAFINEWFAPSVRVAHAGGSRRFLWRDDRAAPRHPQRDRRVSGAGEPAGGRLLAGRADPAIGMEDRAVGCRGGNRRHRDQPARLVAP
jgi:ceramide glucosyltransferase